MEVSWENLGSASHSISYFVNLIVLATEVISAFTLIYDMHDMELKPRSALRLFPEHECFCLHMIRSFDGVQ